MDLQKHPNRRKLVKWCLYPPIIKELTKWKHYFFSYYLWRWLAQNSLQRKKREGKCQCFCIVVKKIIVCAVIEGHCLYVRTGWVTRIVFLRIQFNKLSLLSTSKSFFMTQFYCIQNLTGVIKTPLFSKPK